jgi:hypothetical protein
MRDLTNEILELIGRTSCSLPKDVEDLLARPYYRVPHASGVSKLKF